jgi:uncharacterized protein (DUF2252 family)
MAASFEIAGRDLGFSPADRRDIVLAGAREYREQLRLASRMGTLDAWYAHLDEEAIQEGITHAVRRKELGKKEAREARRDMAKARTRDSVRVMARRAGKVEGELRIVRDPPLITPIEDLLLSPESREQAEQSVRRLIASYRRTLAHDHHPIEEFRYAHMARKVVGVGSVGTRCWIILMLGRDNEDPLFLQAKEAQPSVLEAFAGRSRLRQHGERVVVGQRLMQAASDIFLGSASWQGRDYYVRQLRDMKGTVNPAALDAEGLVSYLELCGWTLARAHARSGPAATIAGYVGEGDQLDGAIASFAVAYAEQTERDYALLVEAVRSGRIDATPGV